MQTRLLTDLEFHATFGGGMNDVTQAGEAVCDIWSYVDEIPSSDLTGFEIRADEVEYVYRSESGDLDHVLVPTRAKNVYLVIVVCRKERSVFGHHVLNLNEKYGEPTPESGE